MLHGGWLVAMALSQEARAGEMSDPAAALVVGFGSIGGGVAGGLAGGLMGAAIGSQMCSDASFECWDPVIGAGLGLLGGGVAGSLGGAALGAQVSERRVGRALLGSLAGVGTGVAIGTLGAVAHSDGLVVTGLFAAAAGVPVGAAIAAGTDSGSVAVLPEVGAHRQGVRLVARF
jgi:hypothetical protein